MRKNTIIGDRTGGAEGIPEPGLSPQRPVESHGRALRRRRGRYSRHYGGRAGRGARLSQRRRLKSSGAGPGRARRGSGQTAGRTDGRADGQEDGLGAR